MLRPVSIEVIVAREVEWAFGSSVAIRPSTKHNHNHNLICGIKTKVIKMSNNQVGTVYQQIIADVVESSRVDFEEGGVDEHVLEELRLVSPPALLVSFPSLHHRISPLSILLLPLFILRYLRGLEERW